MSTDALRAVELERIMRPLPHDSFVIPFSFPVTSFGDPAVARIATVGFSPGITEYSKPWRPGSLLTVGNKRLVDREELGMGLWEIPTREQALKILEGNHDYFKKNPDLRAFHLMENTLLEPLGVSYQAGTAVHLNLIPWATSPRWDQIRDREIKKFLFDAGSRFLSDLLDESPIEFVLINGRERHVAFMKLRAARVNQEEFLNVEGSEIKISVGNVSGAQFISWSSTLSNSHTSAMQRQAISARISEIVSGSSPDVTS